MNKISQASSGSTIYSPFEKTWPEIQTKITLPPVKSYSTSESVLKCTQVAMPIACIASSCVLFPLSLTPFEVRSLHLRLTLWQAQDATKHVDFDSQQVR